MLNSKKIQAILYSLLLFISIISAPASRAFAEGKIKIPQSVINELKELAKKDRKEAEQQLKMRDQAIQNLLKIAEEAEKQNAKVKKDIPLKEKNKK